MKKYAIGSLAFLAFLLVSGQSSAYALIDLNVGGGSNTNASSSQSSEAEIKLNAGAGVQSSSTSGEAGADFESNTLINSGERLNLNRAALKSDVEGEVVTSYRAVITNADLRAYAQTALRSDDNLEELNFTGKTVEVSYKQHGRFLALVPMTFKAKAIAKADGDVELDYPWYAFLTLDDQEQVKTNLKIAVDTALKTRAVGSVRGEREVANPFFTAGESAEVAAQMHVILRNSLDLENEAGQ